jgi:hypothetical protein
MDNFKQHPTWKGTQNVETPAELPEEVSLNFLFLAAALGISVEIAGLFTKIATTKELESSRNYKVVHATTTCQIPSFCYTSMGFNPAFIHICRTQN